MPRKRRPSKQRQQRWRQEVRRLLQTDPDYHEIPEEEQEQLEQTAQDWSYKRCIFCMEKANPIDGPFLVGCGCHVDQALCHYSCLCDNIEAIADRPCRRCDQTFSDPRLVRYTDQPNFRNAARLRAYFTEGVREPDIRRYSLVSVTILVAFMCSRLFGYDIPFENLLITQILGFIFGFVLPMNQHFQRYLRRERAQDMIKFTDYGGPGNHKLVNLNQARAQLFFEEQREEQDRDQEAIELAQLDLEGHALNVLQGQQSEEDEDEEGEYEEEFEDDTGVYHPIVNPIVKDAQDQFVGNVSESEAELDDGQDQNYVRDAWDLFVQRLNEPYSNGESSSDEEQDQFVNQLKHQTLDQRSLGEQSSGQPFLGEPSSGQSFLGEPSSGRTVLEESSSVQWSIGQPHIDQPIGQPIAQPPQGPGINFQEYQDMLDQMPPNEMAKLAQWILRPQEDEEEDNNQG